MEDLEHLKQQRIENKESFLAVKQNSVPDNIHKTSLEPNVFPNADMRKPLIDSSPEKPAPLEITKEFEQKYLNPHEECDCTITED